MFFPERESVRQGQQVIPTMTRLPLDVHEWLQRKAIENLSSKNSEITRAVRAEMAREVAKAAAS
jgi:hypothetical protein